MTFGVCERAHPRRIFTFMTTTAIKQAGWLAVWLSGWLRRVGGGAARWVRGSLGVWVAGLLWVFGSGVSGWAALWVGDSAIQKRFRTTQKLLCTVQKLFLCTEQANALKRKIPGERFILATAAVDCRTNFEIVLLTCQLPIESIISDLERLG